MTFGSKLQGYSISWKQSATKDLKLIPVGQVKNIEAKISKIAQGDSSLDILKLKGCFDMPTYRLRVGDYRVIFEVHEYEIIILIVAVKHRKNAY